MKPPVAVSVRETSPGVWRLTFNGAVHGASRGYSYEDARREALRLVQADHAWVRDDRPVGLVWRAA